MIQLNLDEMFDKWNGWLTILRKEILTLSVNRDIYYGINEIIKSNTKVQQIPSSFWLYQRITYEETQLTAIRRLVKNNKDSISMIRLISQIKDYPSVLSRTRYKDLYRNAHLPESYVNEQFEVFAGKGKNRDIINPEIFIKDFDELKQKATKIETMVDKRVAHFDQDQTSYIRPTYKEMDECIDLIENLIQKYFLIFRAGNIDRIPDLGNDWRAIFKEPWINE